MGQILSLPTLSFNRLMKTQPCEKDQIQGITLLFVKPCKILLNYFHLGKIVQVERMNMFYSMEIC